MRAATEVCKGCFVGLQAVSASQEGKGSEEGAEEDGDKEEPFSLWEAYKEQYKEAILPQLEDGADNVWCVTNGRSCHARVTVVAPPCLAALGPWQECVHLACASMLHWPMQSLLSIALDCGLCKVCSASHWTVDSAKCAQHRTGLWTLQNVLSIALDYGLCKMCSAAWW